MPPSCASLTTISSYAATLRLVLSGTLVVFDIDAGSAIHAVDVDSTASDLVLLGDGGALAALSTGGLVRLRADGTVSPRIELRGETPLTELADGTVLGVSAGRIVEIDPDEHSAVGTVVRAGGHPLTGLLDGNADRLLLGGPDGELSVVDTATFRPVGPPLEPTLPVSSSTPVSLSPDGSEGRHRNRRPRPKSSTSPAVAPGGRRCPSAASIALRSPPTAVAC